MLLRVTGRKFYTSMDFAAVQEIYLYNATLTGTIPGTWEVPDQMKVH